MKKEHKKALKAFIALGGEGVKYKNGILAKGIVIGEYSEDYLVSQYTWIIWSKLLEDGYIERRDNKRLYVTNKGLEVCQNSKK